MVSGPDPDIDPDAKLIVERHGEKVVNNVAIDVALREDRARAAVIRRAQRCGDGLPTDWRAGLPPN